MELEEAVLQVGLGKGLHLVVAEELQIEEHGIGHRQAGGQLLGVLVPVEGGEAGVEAVELPALLLRPDLVRGLSHRLLKAGKPARSAEPQVVDLGQIVEVHIFVIDVAGLGAVFCGQDAGDLGGDAHRAEPAQNAHPLVALHNVKGVHILIGLDGVGDAGVHVGLAQGGPLVAELRVLLHQGEEGVGEGLAPSGGAGAHNELNGNFHHAQVRLAAGGLHSKDLVQHRQIGGTAPDHHQKHISFH